MKNDSQKKIIVVYITYKTGSYMGIRCVGKKTKPLGYSIKKIKAQLRPFIFPRDGHFEESGGHLKNTSL